MTKEDAIQVMSNGHFVRHRHFSDHEYIGIKGGMIITEEGYRCDLIEFFRWRKDESWETDWSVVKDKVNEDEEYNVIANKAQELEYVIFGGRKSGLSKAQRIAITGIQEQGGIVIKTNSKKSEEMRSKGIGLFMAALLSSVAGSNIQADPQFAEPNKTKPKGNRFVIDGVEIYALNRKNAERKYRNLKNKS